MREALNMAAVKETYTDELIRENARLAVQHEADRQRMELLSERAPRPTSWRRSLRRPRAKSWTCRRGPTRGRTWPISCCGRSRTFIL